MNNRKCNCSSDLLNTNINDITDNYNIYSQPAFGELASIFVNFQPDNPDTYTFCEGLENGTIYPSLNKPYISKNCKQEVCHE
ncbi:MAG: spore coat associated protein CotJA [Clostridia bacterium]|nr:spore coat associated protein CotJA [Clostridia bacterium]